MTKILVVFGATGQQGSSIVNFVLNDPELSQEYRIRAITRDPDSEKAQQLKEKVEVVKAEWTDRASIEAALTGVHTVFIVTTFSPVNDYEWQYGTATTTADIAVEKGAKYIIFSTLTNVKKISGGKYSRVVPFDVKAEAEEYIRGLPIKSAFVSLGSFMENFAQQPFVSPRPAGDGTWVLERHTSAETRFPLVDAVGDTGKFVGAILAEPDKYEGMTFHAATALYDLEEIAAIIAKHTGRTVVFKQISAEEWAKTVPWATEVFLEGFSFMDEYGYFGPGSEDLVSWAVKNARGKLTTFEEYLEAHPLKLIGSE
ncbi:hypothetical protein B0H67DRAFT_588248 [Lasiosphaeris hirsuta]|uniref:NmrA-like domain-containing protein n=1 Tax=Lasiosphaeris hirsuta TaxID=260670 RepID=A0AA40A1M1_9PEZI|nr:hypothetical protein B0H67DRAFT_588248 [Lasiosphaeris hirsuta]